MRRPTDLPSTSKARLRKTAADAPFPFRTVDTRGSFTCPTNPGGGVSSVSSIFPKAKALLVSITVVNPSVASYLIAYTGSAQPPSVATLNYDAGEVRSNIALIPLSGDRVTILCGGGIPSTSSMCWRRSSERRLIISDGPDTQCGSLTAPGGPSILAVTPRTLPMADCDNSFARAVRDVTRRCGRQIWSDPGRFRSRLHYELDSVTADEGAVLDAVVIAAVQGIPGALLDHDDLEPWTLALSETVGPTLATAAISLWTSALATEISMPSLLAKLRPPPPARVSA